MYYGSFMNGRVHNEPLSSSRKETYKQRENIDSATDSVSCNIHRSPNPYYRSQLISYQVLYTL